MGLNNIANKDIEPFLHKNQPDVPEKTAEEIKAFFDALSVNVLIPKLNELIDEINKILPESEQAAQYAYSVGQVDELLSKKADKDELTPINENLGKKADKDELTPINESLATKVDAEFVAQEIKDNKPADYVIETGISEGWQYRKWNSGQYEAWRLAVITSSDVSTTGVPGIDIEPPCELMGTKYAIATMNIQSGSTFNPHVYLSCYFGTKINVCVNTAPTGTTSYLVTVKIKANWK